MIVNNLRVLFYNTHLFGDTLGAGAFIRKVLTGDLIEFHDTYRARMISDILALYETDVIGLCEVWDNQISDILCSTLRKVYPWMYRPDMLTLTGDTLGSGLVLFSKYPFVPIPMHPDRGAYYAEHGFFESRSQKGFIRAFLNITSKLRVAIFVTHLQSGDGKKDGEARAKQLRQLTGTIKHTKRDYPDVPIIIMGDFNVVGEDAVCEPTGEYNSMRNILGLTDAYRVAKPDSSQFPGYTSDAKNGLLKIFDRESRDKERLDYVFFDSNGPLFLSDCGVDKFRTRTPINLQESNPDRHVFHLSDHYAIKADFCLKM